MSAVILFDGVCNFCHSSVNFIIRHDYQDYFKFAPLQSQHGRQSIKKYNLQETDSIVLIENGKAFVYSTAVLKIAKNLGGVWSVFYIFIIVPRFVRDFFYKLFARYRYKLFGKKEKCLMPTPEIRQKFLN